MTTLNHLKANQQQSLCWTSSTLIRSFNQAEDVLQKVKQHSIGSSAHSYPQAKATNKQLSPVNEAFSLVMSALSHSSIHCISYYKSLNASEFDKFDKKFYDKYVKQFDSKPNNF